MYNRYIRNDLGTYTRIREEDGIPVPPSGGGPVHGEGPPHNGEPPSGRGPEHGGGPVHGEEPGQGSGPASGGRRPGQADGRTPESGAGPGGDASRSPRSGERGSPPHGPRRRAPAGGGLRRLLDDARMDRIDDGDLLLLGLILFLAREGADEELLTALGLLLIL